MSFPVDELRVMWVVQLPWHQFAHYRSVCGPQNGATCVQTKPTELGFGRGLGVGVGLLGY